MCMPLVESSDSLESVTDDEAGLLSRLEPCSVPECRSKLTLKWVFVFCIFPISIFTRFSFVCFLVTSLHHIPPQFRSSYLSVSTHFHLPRSHYCLIPSFSPHGLNILVSLLLFSPLCLPHLPLPLFIHY